MPRKTRAKGELMDLRVEPVATAPHIVDTLRTMYPRPQFVVRQFDRVVRADGEAQAVVMIVTRRRLP